MDGQPASADNRRQVSCVEKRLMVCGMSWPTRQAPAGRSNIFYNLAHHLCAASDRFWGVVLKRRITRSGAFMPPMGYLGKWRTVRVLSSLVLLCATVTHAASDADHYLINPGDTLGISVWQEPELQGEVTVRPDGYFSFPLAGEVLAARRTVSQVEEAVRLKLREYIPEVVVTVNLQALTGYKIYVIGQVRNPGEFLINTNIDVIRALAMAQGTNEFADLNDIRILRRVDGQQQAIRFNYRAVEKGSDLSQNIMLQAGDVVVVP